MNIIDVGIKSMTQTCGFSTKKNGDMRNIDIMLSFFQEKNIEFDCLVRPEQTHSTNIVVVEKVKKGQSILKIPNCDGVITDIPKVLLSVITGDCVPIIFFDTENKITGLSHQGWKGSFNLLAEQMVQKLVMFGAEKTNIVTLVGPAICGNCYAVSEQRYNDFVDKFFPYRSVAMKKENNNFYIDLKRLNVEQLLSTGILEKNIHISPYCTYEKQKLFYSFRRDTKDEFGEIVSFCMLK
jgi:hypothetical protein